MVNPSITESSFSPPAKVTVQPCFIQSKAIVVTSVDGPDVTFIDEFLTPEFAMQHGLFTYDWSKRNERYEIASREFQAVKQKLLAQLTNFGNPKILVIDGNYENRGELLLRHEHHGTDLRSDYATDTLGALCRVWKRPVVIETLVEGRPVVLRHDGKEHTVRDGTA